jgi:hypothetical protein
MVYEVKPTAEVKPPAQATEVGNELTAPAPPEPYPYYSDIAMTNLFNGYLSLINFERQALWQRYQAMLIGNSIILTIISTFLTKPPADSKPFLALTKYEVYAALTFGTVLCVAWGIMTWYAWGAYDEFVEGGKKFIWDKLTGSTTPFQKINPLNTYINYAKRKWVRGTASFVIVIFIAFYGFLWFRYLQ